jgi:hypothetical protein
MELTKEVKMEHKYDVDEEIKKTKNEIVEYINEYFEPFILKGKVRIKTIDNYGDRKLWFFTKEK